MQEANFSYVKNSQSVDFDVAYHSVEELVSFVGLEEIRIICVLGLTRVVVSFVKEIRMECLFSSVVVSSQTMLFTDEADVVNCSRLVLLTSLVVLLLMKLQ